MQTKSSSSHDDSGYRNDGTGNGSARSNPQNSKW
jgi:hypothetical protein